MVAVADTRSSLSGVPVNYGGLQREGKRLDPDDGKVRTFAEVQARYGAHFSADQVRFYWDTEMKPVAEEEKRLNPEDGKAYSFAELKTQYQGQFSTDEINLYWDNEMRPLNNSIKATAATVVSEVAVAESDIHEGEAAADTSSREVMEQQKTAVPLANGEAAAAASSTCTVELQAPIAPFANGQKCQRNLQDKSSAQLALENLTLQEWLAQLDDNLKQYLGPIQKICSSPSDVVARYAKARPGGLRGLDEKFFEDFGVKKKGHKRMFERFFSELGALDDEVSRVHDALRHPEAANWADDLPIQEVEVFWKIPGVHLCAAAAKGDLQKLAALIALSDIIDVDWHVQVGSNGETILEAAGIGGHRDLCKALVREGIKKPLWCIIKYADADVAEVQELLKAGLQTDVFDAAAALDAEDEERRKALLSLLADHDRACKWLSEALGGSSREWVAALRVANALGVQMTV